MDVLNFGYSGLAMMLANAFDNYFTKLFSEIVSDVDKWAEGFDVLRFSSKYRAVLEQRLSRVKVLGMSKAIPIASIYVELSAYGEVQSRKYRDIDELVGHIERGQSSQDDDGRNDAATLLTAARRALILGKPGSGKTTLLRHLTLALLSKNAPFEAFPIFVPLREYADSGAKTLLEYIVGDAEEYADFQRRTATPFFRRLLRKGRAALFLDGLDEVPVHTRSRVVEEISKLAARYRDARVVVSCRTLDYQGWFGDMEEFEIADFSRNQVVEFIRHWFNDSARRANSLLAIYDDHRSIRELCSTPLLAALVCILYQYNLQLPRNRAELYGECIDALLFKWDASRFIERKSSFAELSTQRKKALLAAVGAELMDAQLVIVPRKRLIDALTRALSRYGMEDGEGVLAEVASHHALLLERSAGMWSFMHLTFQEYFAALAAVQDRKEAELIGRRFNDTRWREVLIMVAALSPHPADVLDALRNALRRSSVLDRIRPNLARVLLIAAHRWQMAEASGFATSDSERLPSELRGKQSVQARAWRDASDIFGLAEFASGSCVRTFGERFGGPIRGWTKQEVTSLSLYGGDATDRFWADVTDFVNQVTLFADSCRQSMLGRSVITPHADGLIHDLVAMAG